MWSEIRLKRRGNRDFRAQEKWILGADRFRPVADEAPIGDPSGPGRGENARVLNGEFDLQALLGRVLVDSAAPIGRIGPKFGSVLSLGLGRGFAVDQAIALQSCQIVAIAKFSEEMAISALKCNTLRGSIGLQRSEVNLFWSMEAEFLAWAGVKKIGNFIEVGLRVTRQVDSFWKILPDEAVGVFV